jgi:hypothetical protein
VKPTGQPKPEIATADQCDRDARDIAGRAGPGGSQCNPRQEAEKRQIVFCRRAGDGRAIAPEIGATPAAGALADRGRNLAPQMRTDEHRQESVRAWT